MRIHRRVVMTAAAVLAAAAAGGGIAVAHGGLAAKAGHGKSSFKIHATLCPTNAARLKRFERVHPKVQCIHAKSRRADVDPARGDNRGGDRASENTGGVECEHPNVEARENRIGSHDADRGDDCVGDNEAKEDENAEQEAPAAAPSSAAANFAG